MVDQERIRSISEKFESNVDYTTVLNNFEGPLDLLLYLINREEIEIKDVFVSQVTEQFLDYMKGLPYLDVDKVSEYLNIAATIIKIKAQALVPNILEDPELDQEIEDDKAELIRALEEYRLIKEETKKLKELETIGFYFKEPDKDVGETRTVFTMDKLTLDGLISAYSTLEERKEVQFEELFTRDFTKPEIITTFQAILELLKYQFLHVKQEQEFGEITISLNPDRDKEADLGNIDEYD